LLLPQQGCQIFLSPTNQIGKNVPNYHKIYQKATKYTKKPQNIPNGSKIDQMAKKIPISSIARPSKIYPILDLWFENMPSGNPVPEHSTFVLCCFVSTICDNKAGHSHRNLRTRRRMHLCMQDNQIGQKFMWLAPADMARLPHLIDTEKVFGSKRPSPSAGTTPSLNLPSFRREIVHF
jgi:hypothetical protein